MYLYRPQEIIVDSEIANIPLVTSILAKFPKINPQFIDRQEWKEKFLAKDNKVSLTKGKKTLYLKKFLGSPIKACPGFSPEAVCCNYYVLDFIENCPLECSYCILQAIHNQPTIVFHANVTEILQRIGLVLTKRQNTQFSIGTGEHSDSLALDHIFELNPLLVDFFAKFPNARLELKTKTNLIEPLLNLDSKGQTVVSWSLNSEELSKKEEHKTASAKARVLAAAKLVEAGYFVGFHFDPLIYYEGWQDGYSEMVDFIVANVNQKKIAWISIGTLRYVPSLKQIAEARFPKMNLFCGEFTQAADGKMKYIRPIREELCRHLALEIKQKLPQVPKYLCMEQTTIWEESMGYSPNSVGAMEKQIRSRVF